MNLTKTHALCCALLSTAAVAQALAQSPARDALKSISDYQRGAFATAGKPGNPDFADVQKKTESMAAGAVSGVDPGTVDAGQALDYAILSWAARDNEKSRAFCARFLASDPTPIRKFQAQYLEMNCDYSLRKGMALDEDLKQAEPCSLGQMVHLANHSADFGDLMACAVGEKDALRVLDQVAKKAIGFAMQPAPESAAADSGAYDGDAIVAVALGEDHSSAAREMKQLKNALYSLTAERAKLLAAARGAKEAMHALDDFAKLPFVDKAMSASLLAKRTFYANIGKPFDLSFTDAIGGKPVDVASMKGKVVLIDFWATWCPGCVAELPRVKEIYSKYHEKGLEVVGVSFDAPEAKGGLTALRDYVAKHDLAWPMYYDGTKWSGKFTTDWGVDNIPSTFVLDRNGILVGVVDPSNPNFETAIQKYLDVQKK